MFRLSEESNWLTDANKCSLVVICGPFWKPVYRVHTESPRAVGSENELSPAPAPGPALPWAEGQGSGAVPRLHHPLYMTLCARSNSSILQLVFTQNGWIGNLRTSLRGKDIIPSAFCPLNRYSKDTIKHNLAVLCSHYILKVVSIIPGELNIEQEAADAICEAMKQRLCFFFHSFHNLTSTRLEND